jgi:hypothetical protein
MSDEPVPIGRAAIGCLVIALVGLGIAALVRPAIFSVAEPRDDSVVIVGTLAEAQAGPFRRDQLLARSYDHFGEVDAGDGRVQVTVIVAPSTFGGLSVVNAASPVADDCPVEIAADRLADCDGRTWTFEGLPIDSADPPLERFAATVDGGAIVVDFTQTAPAAP